MALLLVEFWRISRTPNQFLSFATVCQFSLFCWYVLLFVQCRYCFVYMFNLCSIYCQYKVEILWCIVWFCELCNCIL